MRYDVSESEAAAPLKDAEKIGGTLEMRTQTGSTGGFLKSQWDRTNYPREMCEFALAHTLPTRRLTAPAGCRKNRGNCARRARGAPYALKGGVK